MSEQNILNSAPTSLLNYAWGYSEGLPEMRSSFQASSGKIFSRRQFGRGRVYELAWNNLDKATMHSLRQCERQYENDFFTLADWERGRYFSGRFDGPLIFNPSGNERWNVKGRFIELPGLAMRRVNLLDASEELDLAPWGNFDTAPTVLPNNVADPNGRLTAERIDFPAANSRLIQNFFANQAGLGGQTVTFSVYLWAAAATDIRVTLEDSDGSTFVGTTQQYTLGTTPQRYSVTRTLRSGAVNAWAEISNNFAPLTARSVYAWGAMVNVGSAPFDLAPNWFRDAIFLEEQNGFGEDLVKLTGTWTLETGGFAWAHGLGDYYSNQTNATAEWLYFGYGFRFWHSKNSNLGIVEISATRVRDGSVVLAATQVDLYSAGLVAPAAVLTKSDLPRDRYRVKARCTGMKNASATDYYVRADAIEVMQ